MWRAAMGLLFLLGVGISATGSQEPTLFARRDALLHYRLGLEEMRAEAWEKAALEFKAAIGLDPLMAVAHYNLGQCRMAQKRYGDAVTAYEDCRTAFERLGLLSQEDRNAREQDRRDEINDLKNDLQRLRTAPFNIIQKTTYIEDRIRFLESLNYRDADVVRVPAEVFLALGSAYFRMERLVDAEREYREAIRVNGRLGEAHNNLAVICLLTGRPAEARAEVELAEASGFRVNPRLKDDLDAAVATSTP